MSTYIMLMSWTDQGAYDFQDTIQRADGAAEAFEGAGGALKESYWTMGPYDLVALGDLPDDESASSAALKASVETSVRTTTMRAFDCAEVDRILE